MKKRAVFICVLSAVILIAGMALCQVAYIPPILMYHSISPGEPGDTLHVSNVVFQRQMRFLRENDYTVLPLESLAALIRDKKKIPRKTISITFDDGRKDNYTLAFPVLNRYRIPATVFVVVNDIPGLERLTRDEMNAMVQSELITIGSHTLSHPYLPEVNSPDELLRQIAGSKQALESSLGRTVATFCYPVGGFNAQVRKAVIDAGYACAVTTSPGRRYPNDDIFALKRIKITDKAGNMFIFWAQTSGYYTFFKDLFSSKRGKSYGE